MKAYKIITIISVILLAIIITVASFLGIYKLKDYKVKNIVPNYLVGMDFDSSKSIQFKVDDSIESTTVYDAEGNEVKQEEGKEYKEEDGYKTVENKANSEDKLTEQNYKLCKDILINRLSLLKVNQYTIKQDKTSGNMQIQIKDNDSSNDIIKSLMQVGKFELKDEESGEVLMDNSYVSKAVMSYGRADEISKKTTVYVQIYFNKDGAKKLEEISKTYVSTTVQVENDEGVMEDKEETKNVSIVFDGETYRTTYFGQTMTDGILNLAIGSGESEKDLQDYMKEATRIVTVLNTGVMPIKYEVTQIDVQPYIDSSIINTVMYIFIAIIATLCIYLIIKFKLTGLLVSIIEIGYIALLLLTIRYTNVVITLEGIIGIVISIILNYIFNFEILNSIKKDEVNIKNIIVKSLIKLIPLYVITAVFTLINNVNISSLGMTLFWGIIIMYLYNLLVTKTTLDIVTKK